jgi:hypothetical protein
LSAGLGWSVRKRRGGGLTIREELKESKHFPGFSFAFVIHYYQ